MRIQVAAAFAAAALALLAPPLAASPASDGPGTSLAAAQYFQSAARALVRAERVSADGADTRTGARRRNEEDESGGTVRPIDDRFGYAIGGALLLGVVSSFVLGPRGSRALIAVDPPVTQSLPHNDGDPSTQQPDQPGQPNQPGQPEVLVPVPVVTPEPASLLLFATGLSSLGAAGLGRRRRTVR